MVAILSRGDELNGQIASVGVWCWMTYVAFSWFLFELKCLSMPINFDALRQYILLVISCHNYASFISSFTNVCHQWNTYNPIRKRASLHNHYLHCDMYITDCILSSLKYHFNRPVNCVRLSQQHSSRDIDFMLRDVTYDVTTVNSLPPSAAYMRQWIGSALVQIMTCRLFGTKPLSKPMLGYYQLGPEEQTPVKF